MTKDHMEIIAGKCPQRETLVGDLTGPFWIWDSEKIHLNS